MIKSYSKISIVIFLLFVSIQSCTTKNKIDLIIYNGVVYTIDSSFTVAEAIAVSEGKIIAVGTSKFILDKYDAAETIDAKNMFIYPGLIDAHTHFFRYGLALQTVDLTGTGSWEECIERVSTFVKKKNIPEGVWIQGRGWDQNDWKIKSYPDRILLDSLFPKNPVLLSRVDGHGAIANGVALERAGIKLGTKLAGGEIETKNDRLTGILIDNAVDLVTSILPAVGNKQISNALMDAQQKCFEVGLTTVDDCGINYEDVLLIDSLQQTGNLKMRIYALLSDMKKNYDAIFKRGKIKTERLNVSSFKVYADGALGSRGACLLQHYSDKPGWNGFLLSTPQHFDSVAQLIYSKGFQMCTHAIGDSGNRMILKTYAKYLKGKNNLRWRVEHAQVVNKNDINLFGENSIVPSVQPTHATSDMYWAEDRLGSERMKNAYAYKELLKQNGWIPLGTDFPVEDISPIKTFYAAVVRKDAKGKPDGGFLIDNALTREEALRGITLWAAKSNFEEKEKGSIEPGKYADIVMLDKDLTKAEPEKILDTKVIITFVNGEIVYKQNP
ncbi:MAG: amidohydrolase [Bacteroidia bacterium]|nr:amidohydrolase [Bacteroidia bacterium]